MNVRHLLVATLLIPTAGTAFAGAQQPKPADHPSVSSSANTPAKTYPLDQILTATVHDAWMLSGKNEDAFFDIVEQLAQSSAQKRGITLPNTEAAGRRMGELIKTRAKADHDALLYAIVDNAVRSLGTKTVAAK